VFLISNLLLFFSCIMCATNKNFEWHLAARCLAALSGAQCEALVPLIIQVSSTSSFSIRTNPSSPTP
jgi:predicted MFS family arabinose efflux permease